MQTDDLQAMCESGQDALMAMRYLEAERILAGVEKEAWGRRDWDTLSRVYMPLQEARRQKRQRCGEGVVRLDRVAREGEELDAGRIVAECPHGQLLVAGWGSIAAAARVRRLAEQRGLYLETFLAAVYPAGAGRLVAVVPTDNVALPDARAGSVDQLILKLPPHSLAMGEAELPAGSNPGTTHTFARVMDLWERLHRPFLAAADMEADPVRRMEGYRRTIAVDYACELAHQKLSDAARGMVRRR